MQTQSDPAEPLRRAFTYRWLAKAYEYPDTVAWQLLCDSVEHLHQPASELLRYFCSSEYEQFLADYISAFGHAARGPCPLNEIEYGELKADPLIQPHRLADLAAFYRAFGL